MTENPLASDLEHVLEHTRDLWEELRGERIFITGGTGFFGCWLLESFCWANDRLNLGAEVVALTRSPVGFKAKAPHLHDHPAVHPFPGDMGSFTYPEGNFSCIIHSATENHPERTDRAPLSLYEQNVQGTGRVLDFSSRCSAHRFLFVSSGAVYGKQPPDLPKIPEEYKGAPETTDLKTAYGQSKRASEFLCCGYTSPVMGVTIARGFAFVGPYLPLSANYAIGNFIRDALAGDKIVVSGDGTPYRSYLYSADLAIWLWTLLLKGQSGRVYNMGSDQEITIADLADLVAREVNPRATVKITGTPIPGGPVERYIPSIHRASSDLGLQVWIPLDRAIRHSADYFMRWKN